MDLEAKRKELEELRARVRRLEAELAAAAPAEAPWVPPTYYTTYHVLAGFVLGMFGAATSLLFNVVGSLLVGQHPLQLIRVYLTFPLGEAALTLGQGGGRLSDEVTLAAGCCLYLAGGMVMGVPFHLVLSRCLPQAGWATRLAAVSAVAVAVWLFNYYAVLSWLQPLLFGGDWIVREVPPWVAALTHLVFGWTMLLVQPLGRFTPYRRQAEA